MKHFLLFQLQSVCYGSYTYFSASLARALQAKSHNITVFSAKERPLEEMEEFAGQAFDAVIDINSHLPKLKMEEGGYFLDEIHAPFYDIILDHPLYHHDMLKQTIKNFHVICLDQGHKTYIETYYPHIASVHVLPMTGEDIAQGKRDYPQKSIDLFFSGSYTSPKSVAASIEDIPGFLGDLTKDMINLIQKNVSLSQEAAMTALLPSCDEIVEELFPLHMQACFLCDSYIRAWRREQLLIALAESHIAMTICGNGWRNSPLADYKNISIIDDTAFSDTFAYFRQAKITLNIMPEFKHGAHDRVYSAMLNHSLCLTDPTPMLKEQFRDNCELVFYPADDGDALCQTAEALLKDNDKIKTISQQGYEKAITEHTWQNRVEKLLEILEL